MKNLIFFLNKKKITVMQSSIGQLKSYKIDSIINNRIKIIFTQLNSSKFKELIKYLGHQNEYIRLEFSKQGIIDFIPCLEIIYFWDWE